MFTAEHTRTGKLILPASGNAEMFRKDGPVRATAESRVTSPGSPSSVRTGGYIDDTRVGLVYVESFLLARVIN